MCTSIESKGDTANPIYWKIKSPEIAIIGLGNVGLGKAIVLANEGFPVIGLDIDFSKVRMINRGINTSAERSLDKICRKVIHKGLLRCTTNYHAIREARLIFIAVGSPPSNDKGSRFGLNLEPLLSATRSIATEVLREVSNYKLIAIRTTVPLGATRIVKAKLEELSGKSCGSDFGLCYNPEMLAVGRIMKGVLEPDFILIGECDKRAGDELEAFYQKLHRKRKVKIVRVDPPTAEMTKLVCNAYLSMKITFANNVSELCERIPGVDAKTILETVGLDRRIGRSFLMPGLSYGGSCFPKDLRSLILMAEHFGFNPQLFRNVETLNEEHIYAPIRLAKMLRSLEGKTVSVLGLAYKAGISDTRESPSLKMISYLLKEGANVRVYDPNIRQVNYPGVTVADTLQDCLENSDCCIIATSEGEFRCVTQYVPLMRTPVVVDGVRLLNLEENPNDLVLLCIGRSHVPRSANMHACMRRDRRN